jgi:diguanylate cyclase (GGDEF)-like protein
LAVWTVRSGETWTFHAFVHDVTLRKQAEDALRQLNGDLEAERNAVRNLNRLLEARVRERTRNLRQANQELRDRHHQLLDARAQAATDGLTGLGNHRSFQEHVRQSISAAGSDRSFSLVMLDVDGFKKINDSLGHQAGDGVLRGCAHAFAAVVGEQSVYRSGGDEFAVLLPDCDIAGAEEVAERLRRAALDISAPITVSLGVASYPETAGTSDELIYQADSAMYAAKMAGKNRTCRWDRMPSAPSRTPRQRSTPVA